MPYVRLRSGNVPLSRLPLRSFQGPPFFAFVVLAERPKRGPREKDRLGSAGVEKVKIEACYYLV
jgi:hypothetical protein